MASLTFELVTGNDQVAYDALISELPAGENNLARGVVVPSHPANKPQTFKINNVTPNTPYMVDFVGEWATAPTPRIYFIPTGTYQLITVALPYGPVTATVKSTGETRQFLISVSNYAVFFRAYAKELTEYSLQPLAIVQDSIANPLAYRLATPLLTGLTSLIPSDLEILSALSYKLLTKSLLHRPESEAAAREILSAFSATNPIFFKMQNLNEFDSPMYRSEEIFQGYEAHVWFPNNEMERWKAFITLLANLPQLYSIRQITESEVYVQVGDILKRHRFDFNSPQANSITTGVAYLSDCFLKLFKPSVTVSSEHWLSFCQASYVLDQLMSNSLFPINDPVGIKRQLPAWSGYSLCGRLDQQYDIENVHDWYYDSPLFGNVDGFNSLFYLSKMPISVSAVKLFVDGLLKRMYVDYRVSISGDIISGATRIMSSTTRIVVEAPLGDVRPFKGPTFSSLEVRGEANLQMLLTGIETGLDNVSFVISHRPTVIPNDLEEIAVHFVTPKVASSGIIGENQYGTIDLVEGLTSYDLTFNQPTLALDYQLLVSITIDPMPNTNPDEVAQIAHLVRTHTQNGATIDFSHQIPANAKLNWWVIEDDLVSLERGTLQLDAGATTVLIPLTGGPYYDQVVVLLQLWHLDPSYITAPIYLTSFILKPSQIVTMFSAPLGNGNYRLDYCVFESRGGNFLEFYDPPAVGSIIEAHYDTKWKYWINSGLTPPPDGQNKEFYLPSPCQNPESVYLAMDGRLMNQGADKQYILQSDKVIFKYPPTAAQVLWAVYPINPNGDTLPSTWEQGKLLRLPESIGEYATGWLQTTGDKITPTESIELAGVKFEAKDTAEGRITNIKSINLGDSVSWPDVHSITIQPSAIDLGTYRFSYSGHTFTDGLLIRVSTTGTLPTGLVANTLYKVAGASLIDFALTDLLNHPIAVTNEGTGLHTFTNAVVLAGINNQFDQNGDLIPTTVNQFRIGYSQDQDAEALVAAINAHPSLSLRFVAKYLGLGVTSVKALALGNGYYNRTMTALGTSFGDTTNITGDSAPSSYTEAYVRSEGYCLTVAADTLTDNTFNGIHRLTDGDEVKIVTVGTLPTGLTSGAVYYVTNATSTSFQLRYRSKSTLDNNITLSPIVPFTGGTGSFTIHRLAGALSLNSDIHLDSATSTFNYVDHGLFEGLKVTIVNVGSKQYAVTGELHPDNGYTTILGSLPVGLQETKFYYVSNVTSDSFQLANEAGVTVLFSTSGEGFQLISRFDLADNIFRIKNQGFIANGPVTLSSEELPPEIQSGTIYYVLNQTVNSLQLSLVPSGSPLSFTDIGSEIKITAYPHFPAGNNKLLDTASLYREINTHPLTKILFELTLNADTIIIKKKAIGRSDLSLSVSGNSILVKNLSEGKDPDNRLSYQTSKMCYNYKAPVTALDGLSTVWLEQYNGDTFLFDAPPISQQEGYFISEVFPIEPHPLDSTAANLPTCNYPKGVFTQGFCTHISETSIDVLPDIEVIVTTANMPVQEGLQPTSDPKVFTISLISCAGQESLMLWIDGVFQSPVDGVFQSPAAYSYADDGHIGRITLPNAPTSEQHLWVWYLPMGSSCAYERVDALAGNINGSNTDFTVPEAWIDSETLVVFLEGLFSLQLQDYIMLPSSQIRYNIAPATGQSLWAHYNLGLALPTDRWRQTRIGITNGTDNRYEVYHMLTSELPISVDATLLFLDGLNQGGMYSMELDDKGNPNGWIVFHSVPEANRTLDAVFIKAT